MKEIITTNYKFDIGDIKIGVMDDHVVLVDWRYRKMRRAIDQRIEMNLGAEMKEGEHPLHRTVILQLQDYFDGARKEFDFPVKVSGTLFQKSVWEELLKIPYGKTSTYAQMAENLDNPDAVRAVATANGANALAIIYPCHRVIGSDGSLTGYAGGLRVKKKLLDMEKGARQLNMFDK